MVRPYITHCVTRVPTPLSCRDVSVSNLRRRPSLRYYVFRSRYFFFVCLIVPSIFLPRVPSSPPENPLLYQLISGPTSLPHLVLWAFFPPGPHPTRPLQGRGRPSGTTASSPFPPNLSSSPLLLVLGLARHRSPDPRVTPTTFPFVFSSVPPSSRYHRVRDTTRPCQSRVWWGRVRCGQRH